MDYMFDGNERQPPADLVMANTPRANALSGCTEGSMEEDGCESLRRRQRLNAPERQP